MNKKLKMIIWIVVSIVALVLVAFFSYNLYLSKTEKIPHPEVTFEIENFGTVKMELYPEYAPNTVSNIIKLVESGYYNNKIIYGKDELCMYIGRNAEGDIDPVKISTIDSNVEADSEEDYEYAISGEFVLNGYEKNVLKHEKGTVSLIRNDYTQYFPELKEQSYNSGVSQIGIMMNDARTLNGVYAGFGKITEGLEILEKVYNEVEIKEKEEDSEVTSDIDVFKTFPIIKSATVDTKGVNYNLPETIKAFDYNSYLSNVLSEYYTQEQ